jgi:hypothetical protein
MGRAGLERLNQRYRFRHYRARLQERLASVIPELAAGENVPGSISTAARDWEFVSPAARSGNGS